MNTRNQTSAPKKHKDKNKDREIAHLRSELAAERKRTAALERELSELKREMQKKSLADPQQPIRRLTQKARGTHKEERLLDEANRRAHRYRKSSFFRYLWEAVRDSVPAQLVTKLVTYLRRMQVFQTVLAILTAVGAVVAVAVVSATVLPFLFFGTGLLTILALMRSRRMNRILKKELTDRRIRVLIPPRGHALDEGSFFIRNARAMAAEDHVTVIVVSPYVFSKRGLGGHGRFFTARKEGDDLYLARRHYFFVLRRKVLDALDGEITVIY